ncbi:MAG: hypothetical protein LQ337_004511 [Flavoplaca oasis]|nr:MAG: hypothetical protein LQ337_004511 [Flavoplaca oasis]
MDTLKNMMGSGGENKPVEGQAQGQTGEQASGGGGFMDKINSMAGGGKESEAKEDYLDKGECIDMFQEKVMGAGPQDNESAIEQAKDEQMSDFIRGKYKSQAGTDFPIKDKE